MTLDVNQSCDFCYLLKKNYNFFIVSWTAFTEICKRCTRCELWSVRIWESEGWFPTGTVFYIIAQWEKKILAFHHIFILFKKSVGLCGSQRCQIESISMMVCFRNGISCCASFAVPSRFLCGYQSSCFFYVVLTTVKRKQKRQTTTYFSCSWHGSCIIAAVLLN